MRLFVEQLTIIDFSYLHAERGLVGDSWRVDLELEGVLDDQGMLLDFGDIKRQFKQAIDQEFDHKLLIPENHPGLVREPVENGERITFPYGNDYFIQHSGPESAQTFIAGDEINLETVANAITQHLQSLLPTNISGLSLSLAPESAEQIFYQYSHGLKHHGGNCQRIAHGHRSRIQISTDGERNSALEKQWADDWRDIYVATREDLVGKESHRQQAYLRFSYGAAQGNFELLIPENRCRIIDTESTVENIAQFIADQIAAKKPGMEISVRAFEGIGKGAIGTAKSLRGEHS